MGIPCAVRHFFWLRKWLNYWRGLLFFRLMWYHQSDWETEKTRQLCNYYILHTNSNIKIACLISKSSSLYSLHTNIRSFPSECAWRFSSKTNKNEFTITNKFRWKYKFVLRPLSAERNCFSVSGKIMVFLFLALIVAVHLWNNSRGVRIRNHHLSKYMHWNENIYV